MANGRNGIMTNARYCHYLSCVELLLFRRLFLISHHNFLRENYCADDETRQQWSMWGQSGKITFSAAAAAVETA